MGSKDHNGNDSADWLTNATCVVGLCRNGGSQKSDDEHEQ
jgi:hypothetical protein